MPKSPNNPDDAFSLDNPDLEPNWVDGGDETTKPSPSPAVTAKPQQSSSRKTLIMVETAFLASTSSLIWLINYYFPLGPLLRIFFPIPIALAYLRWGSRAAWMSALITGLLLSVLMGPTRSIVFLMPYGFMGVQLGFCWRAKARWEFSIFTGALIGTVGLLFRFWLFSILLGEDLWLYAINQATAFINWLFLSLGILSRPDAILVQVITIIAIFLNSLLYLFAVHLVALLILERLGSPITRPPAWVQALLDTD